MHDVITQYCVIYAKLHYSRYFINRIKCEQQHRALRGECCSGSTKKALLEFDVFNSIILPFYRLAIVSCIIIQIHITDYSFYSTYRFIWYDDIYMLKWIIQPKCMILGFAQYSIKLCLLDVKSTTNEKFSWYKSTKVISFPTIKKIQKVGCAVKWLYDLRTSWLVCF